MARIFILNGHQPYEFARGRLNGTFAQMAEEFFLGRGDEVHATRIIDGYGIDEEIANHRWADIVFMQFPVNWMGVSWSFKKYMDEVYTAGMDGRMSKGDGRSAESPKDNYGLGGVLEKTTYMLSVTLNAPAEAFDDPSQTFFAGISLDDLLRPVHLNAKFFAMTPLPTFAAFDVMKNADVQTDFARFNTHMVNVFGTEAKRAHG